jgi:hypothetical protein
MTEVYRLAVLLSGDPQTAEECVCGTINDLSRSLAQVRDTGAATPLIVAKLRERILAKETSLGEVSSGNAATSDVVTQIYSLPEPQRSALALFHVDLLKTSEIARVLDISVERLAEILADARAQLKQRVPHYSS